MKNNYPCLDCKKRRVGCHSGCEDYMKAKAKFDVQAKIERNERRLNYEMRCYKDDAMHRMVKNKVIRGKSR